jgi:hypothetical protein
MTAAAHDLSKHCRVTQDVTVTCVVRQVVAILDEPKGKDTVEISVCRVRPDTMDTAFTVELIRAPVANNSASSAASPARPVSMPLPGHNSSYEASRFSPRRCANML